MFAGGTAASVGTPDAGDCSGPHATVLKARSTVGNNRLSTVYIRLVVDLCHPICPRDSLFVTKKILWVVVDGAAHGARAITTRRGDTVIPRAAREGARGGRSRGVLAWTRDRHAPMRGDESWHPIPLFSSPQKAKSF